MERASLVGFAVAAGLTAGLATVAVSLLPPAPPRWKVTDRVTAQWAMVLHVEAQYQEEAMAIARELGEPFLDRYTEILIFFYRPDQDEMVSRIQWTRAHGYVQTIY